MSHRPQRTNDSPKSRTAAESLGARTYWVRSMRPLHVLVFLLPLLVAFEVGSIYFLSNPATGLQQRTIEAERVMTDFFRIIGATGSLMPCIALATVLLVWHIMSRDGWILHLKTLAGMFAEVAAWTLPLLVLSAGIEHARAAAAFGDVAMLPTLAPDTTDRLRDLPLGTRLTLSIGAGLYEEMLFRLIGLAVLHFILADLIALPQKWASILAVVLSALAFAAYHQPVLPRDWAKTIFYILSGIYFGTVYVLRGFGIVVGTHALYDVLVLAVLAG